MIAIVAALPREIAALVSGTKTDAALMRQGIHLHRKGDVVVVAAGMGALRVSRAVEAALAVGMVSDVISVGLAGGCAPGVDAGAVLEATVVVDAHTGERYMPACEPSGESLPVTLVSTDAIASVQEKVRLHASYGALMVDMEAATVARLARTHGLRFRAIKGISDAHDHELASLGRFTGKHGHFRTGAFALHTAVRPHHWAKAAQLGRDSSRALTGLEQALRLTLELHRVQF